MAGEDASDGLWGPTYRGRLAPSPTGEAHLGTLLSALIAWCDARHAGGRLVLRLDDLDRARCRPLFARQIASAFAWLGLDWDAEVAQSQRARDHARALDALAEAGRLYTCLCPRRRLRALAGEAGLPVYDNRCRDRRLGAQTWRRAELPLRAHLPPSEATAAPGAEGALPNSLGDPVVRRADGTVAYLLASVLDDGFLGTTCVVRGADLAPLTTTQAALARLFGLPVPHFRHHFLLRRPDGHKLAKRRQAPSPMRALGPSGGAQLCGQLAFWAGLSPTPAPTSPAALLPTYAWPRVRLSDVTVPEAEETS